MEVCMLRLRTVLCMVVALGFALLLTRASVRAQTASTSTVTGTVSDKTGSSVPNARVDLEDVGTKAKTSVITGSDGGYTFPSVRPGNYSITVSGKGFRQSVVSGVKVEVGKSALVNVTLEVGGMTETVEVTAGTGIELQTLDSSIGNVLDANMLSNMPNINRDATSLVLLQPMAIPGFNGAVSGSGEGNSNDWLRGQRPETFTRKPFTENPEWRDNRVGGKIGGPIWKDRTFFFLFEEERHFFTQAVFQRLVPSAALRAGILKFRDASPTT